MAMSHRGAVARHAPGGLLPAITAQRGGGGMLSARSNMSNMSRRPGGERFTKLKGVIVNNLLKAYHKQTNKKHDDEVYRRAIEEVDRILAGGKLTERDLQNLQRSFAKEMAARHASQTAANNAPSHNPPDHHAQNQPHPGGALNVASAQGGAGAGGAPLPSHRSSAKKAKKNVDEWSVLTLYNDVVHLEEQKVVKAKELQDKEKTRQTLLHQIEEKKRIKAAAKIQEREAANEQQRKYQEWKRERDRQEELRIQKIMADRTAEAEVLRQVQQRKKAAAERDLEEQQGLLKNFAAQIQEEKAQLARQAERKAAAYQKVLIENEKDLERKRLIKQKEREEDERLFKLQIEMADHQENMRALREQERQDRLKKAERAAGELGNRAAELEEQVENRVRQAQERHRVDEARRDREKKERKEKSDKETHTVLQQQIKMHEDFRAVRKREEREMAEQFRREAEAFKMQQKQEKAAKRMKEMEHRAMLDQQLLQREARDANESAMSEIELRLNANILRKVVDSDVGAQAGRGVPDNIRKNVEHAEQLKAEYTPRTNKP